jgi:hypothetical protein
MKPPRVRWNTTEARVERFVRLAQRLDLPVYGFEVRGRDVIVLIRATTGQRTSRRRRPTLWSAGSATTLRAIRRRIAGRKLKMIPVY